jgi:hypothetical protein
VESIPGFGEFALYHGNLGVGENNEAALYLAQEVFNDIAYPLIIAGNNPGSELRRVAEGSKNIRIIDKIDTRRITQLIRSAHINVLPTFQNTGMKLKLINALYQGRHCIVNNKMVHNTGLEELCIVANSPEKMKAALLNYAQQAFTNEKILARRRILEETFYPERNAFLLADVMDLIPARAVSGSLL